MEYRHIALIELLVLLTSAGRSAAVPAAMVEELMLSSDVELAGTIVDALRTGKLMPTPAPSDPEFARYCWEFLAAAVELLDDDSAASMIEVARWQEDSLCRCLFDEGFAERIRLFVDGLEETQRARFNAMFTEHLPRKAEKHFRRKSKPPTTRRRPIAEQADATPPLHEGAPPWKSQDEVMRLAALQPLRAFAATELAQEEAGTFLWSQGELEQFLELAMHHANSDDAPAEASVYLGMLIARLLDVAAAYDQPRIADAVLCKLNERTANFDTDTDPFFRGFFYEASRSVACCELMESDEERYQPLLDAAEDHPFTCASPEISDETLAAVEPLLGCWNGTQRD